MRNTLKNYLLKDYELIDNPYYYLRLSIIIGLALTAYVFFFDPYENYVDPPRYDIAIPIIQLGYGMNATLTIYAFYWFMFRKIGFGSPKLPWKTYQHFVLLIVMVITMGYTGLAYHRLLMDVGEVDTSYVLLVTAPRTILIAVSFIMVSVLLDQLHLKEKRLKNISKSVPDTAKKESQDTTIFLESPAIKQEIALSPQNLLYFKSYGNYVEICSKDNDNTKLLRAPLHYVAKKLSAFPFIVQCHRQYYVNVQQVAALGKNAKQRILLLKDNSSRIPVSKGHFKKVSSLIN
ncbi:LytTR family DNA-binding domain-containing protein [Spongiimicrobium salis]|uniref:LytTR family DNA-binding domain-containing protein n=1 Tax=Spongiimicrobium salis TaxID=1667022 RepID=UPI00374D24B8